jgi:hypothetical protein
VYNLDTELKNLSRRFYLINTSEAS